MENAQIVWQFKNTTLQRNDVDAFIGATHSCRDEPTTLRFKCKRASKDAKRKASEVNAEGDFWIVIEELG